MLQTELHRHIGGRVDIPAGDIGVGVKEIGEAEDRGSEEWQQSQLHARPEGLVGTAGKPYATHPPTRPRLPPAGYLFGQFKRITGLYTSSLTGKGCAPAAAGWLAGWTAFVAAAAVDWMRVSCVVLTQRRQAACWPAVWLLTPCALPRPPPLLPAPQGGLWGE